MQRRVLFYTVKKAQIQNSCHWHMLLLKKALPVIFVSRSYSLIHVARTKQTQLPVSNWINQKVVARLRAARCKWGATDPEGAWLKLPPNRGTQAAWTQAHPHRGRSAGCTQIDKSQYFIHGAYSPSQFGKHFFPEENNESDWYREILVFSPKHLWLMI